MAVNVLLFMNVIRECLHVNATFIECTCTQNRPTSSKSYDKLNKATNSFPASLWHKRRLRRTYRSECLWNWFTGVGHAATCFFIQKLKVDDDSGLAQNFFVAAIFAVSRELNYIWKIIFPHFRLIRTSKNRTVNAAICIFQLRFGYLSVHRCPGSAAIQSLQRL